MLLARYCSLACDDVQITKVRITRSTRYSGTSPLRTVTILDRCSALLYCSLSTIYSTVLLDQKRKRVSEIMVEYNEV